jgi:type IV pilus assembly protein PilN
MMLLASAVVGVVALFALIGWMGARIDGQQERNAYLQNEIKSLDKQIEEIKELDKTKSQLLTRKQIIEQLQSNRSQMVHLFDEMVKTIPDGVRLTSMKQAGDILTLEGVAESNARVASYMRNIDNSPWMGRTDLRKIENKSGTKDIDKKAPYVFSLDVKLRKPEDAQTEKAVAEGGAASPDAGGTAGATATAAPASPPMNSAAATVDGAMMAAGAPSAPAPAAKDAEKGEKK